MLLILLGGVVPLLLLPGVFIRYDSAPKFLLTELACAAVLAFQPSLRLHLVRLWRTVEGRGVILLAVIIAGVVLNTTFLVREIRRNEQHDAFINAMTHELKTPIASIRLYLETLQSRTLTDELRIALEERASLSPDSLTGLEANLRFGPGETMLTRIFGRLSAWQNWIFIRPNAVGEGGALKVFGTGRKARFNWERV